MEFEQKVNFEYKVMNEGWGRYLRDRYNEKDPELQYEDSRKECIGGPNFASTLTTVIRRSKDPVSPVSVISLALNKIVDKPNAGSVAWEMRRFIRRSTTDQMIRYGQLVMKHLEFAPADDRLFGYDFFIYDAPEDREQLKKFVDNYLDGYEEFINNGGTYVTEANLAALREDLNERSQ